MHREIVEGAIKIFLTVAGAEDRIARSYFRKYLILSEMDYDDESAKALAKARSYRRTLTGKGQVEDDTVEVYDSLVSYYNK